MDWVVGILVPLIVAAIGLGKVLYKKKNQRQPKNVTNAQATTNLNIVLPPPQEAPLTLQEAPLDPPSIKLITTTPTESSNIEDPIDDNPTPLISALEFSPVKSEARYQDIDDPDLREQALLKDLYRISEKGLRIEDPLVEPNSEHLS